MKIYRCKLRFFCTPLKRYLPVNALIGRYENAARIVLQDAPQSDQDPFTTLLDGFVFDSPAEVSWLYAIEPPPLGSNTDFFTLVDSKDEDQFGNVSGTSDGLPVLSKLKIVSDVPYLYNPTTGKWNAIQVSGPDGNVSLDIDQTGVNI